MKVAVSGIRVFAAVIKLRSYWMRVGPNPMTDVLVGGKLDRHRKMPCEAGTAVTPLQDKGHHGWLAATRSQKGAGWDSSPDPEGIALLKPEFGFWPPKL